MENRMTARSGGIDVLSKKERGLMEKCGDCRGVGDIRELNGNGKKNTGKIKLKKFQLKAIGKNSVFMAPMFPYQKLAILFTSTF